MYSKMVKWRQGSAKDQQYIWAEGWFFHFNGAPVGPYKSKSTAQIAEARKLLNKAYIEYNMDNPNPSKETTEPNGSTL